MAEEVAVQFGAEVEGCLKKHLSSLVNKEL
jgi:hypothetical protein